MISCKYCEKVILFHSKMQGDRKDKHKGESTVKNNL